MAWKKQRGKDLARNRPAEKRLSWEILRRKGRQGNDGRGKYWPPSYHKFVLHRGDDEISLMNGSFI